MDTVSTLTTMKAPKFDPNVRSKIKNSYSTKSSSQKSNALFLHDPSLKKLKCSKGSQAHSRNSNQLKNPQTKVKTSKKYQNNKENIES